MKLTRMSIAAVGALGTLNLTACGFAGEESTHPDTSTSQTVTQSITTTATTGNGNATETVTQPSTTQADHPANATDAPPAQQGGGSAGIPITEGTAGIGEKVDVDGEAAEVCVYGDGFGINTVAAGTNTSCEFARATLDALTGALNPTTENVRDTLPRSVTVHSPVTGADYELESALNQEKIVSCRGGNNASVHMY